MDSSILKKLIIVSITIIGIMVVVQSGSYAQKVKLTSYMEKTSVSPKIGASAGYRFGMGFETGLFYQKEVTSGFEERSSLDREEEFYGLYLSMPVVNKERYGLDFVVRTGSVNKDSFTITPSIHFSYRPLPFMGISAGVGVRNLRPTLIPKLEITF